MVKRPRLHLPELDRARNCAVEILNSVGIEFPEQIEVELLAFHRGAFVQYLPLEGHLGRRVRRTITVDSRIVEQGRVRFTLAHELGHFELHRKAEMMGFCTNADLSLMQHNQKPTEREANAFASELLMPSRLFCPLCDHEPDWELIEELAARFKTTLTATAMRFIDCTAHRCVLVVSDKGQVQWNRQSEALYKRGVEIREGALNSGTYAHDMFSGDTKGLQKRQTLMGSWIQGYESDRETTIVEQSRPLPSYGRVLTLLTWPPTEDEDEEDWY